MSTVRNCDYLHPAHTGEGLWRYMQSHAHPFNEYVFLNAREGLIAFWRVRPLAGALLIPYALWVAYATALTAAVWRMNPALLG